MIPEGKLNRIELTPTSRVKTKTFDRCIVKIAKLQWDRFEVEGEMYGAASVNKRTIFLSIGQRKLALIR